MRSGCHCTPITQFESLVHSTASITPSGARPAIRRFRPSSLTRLVVGAIDESFIRTGQLRELRSRLNPRGMKGLWRVLLAVPLVLDLRADVAGNILDERASQKHVEALNAEADRQNRLMLGEGVLQEREIGPFAVRVRIGGFRLSSGAITRGINVCGASAQNHPIQSPCELLEFVR